MAIVKTATAWARSHTLWLALAALPFILAACQNSGSGGNGY